jgi:prevent-host-death family protein
VIDPSSSAVIVLPCISVSNTVGIRELRQQASAVLKRVAAGEIIEVTDHGHPIARIVPLRPGPLDQLVVEGRATPADGDLLDLLDDLSLPAPPSGAVLPSVALAELRRRER